MFSYNMSIGENQLHSGVIRPRPSPAPRKHRSFGKGNCWLSEFRTEAETGGSQIMQTGVCTTKRLPGAEAQIGSVLAMVGQLRVTVRAKRTSCNCSTEMSVSPAL